jgi:hypothetical protein
MPSNPRAIAPPGSALSPMTCASACLAVSRGKRPERSLAETLRRCDARHRARWAVVLKANLGVATLTASPPASGGERSNGRHLRGQFWFLGARLPRGACILCARPEQKRPRNLPTLQAAGSAHVDQNSLRPLRLRARMRSTCFDERILVTVVRRYWTSPSATTVASSPNSVASSEARPLLK